MTTELVLSWWGSLVPEMFRSRSDSFPGRKLSYRSGSGIEVFGGVERKGHGSRAMVPKGFLGNPRVLLETIQEFGVKTCS